MKVCNKRNRKTPHTTYLMKGYIYVLISYIIILKFPSLLIICTRVKRKPSKTVEDLCNYYFHDKISKITVYHLIIAN